MLNYVTYKYVILKDYRLGLSYYVLAIAIVLYTLTEIVFNKGYLMIDSKPHGFVRVILSDDLPLLSPSSLPYCQASNISCHYETPHELNWPFENHAVSLLTFAKDKLQVAISDSPQRDEYRWVNETQYFTLGPEHVTIKIDHAVVTSLFNGGKTSLAGSKRQMKGFLINSNGSILRQLSVPGKPDKVTLLELLQAGGVANLDDLSDAISAKGQTYRQRGMVLQVLIYYQNWFHTWYGTSDIEYSYQVRHIPYMDYNTKQTLPYATPTSDGNKWRLLRKRYSVRVEFQQAGSLGMFSFSSFLLKLVSGVGLLTLTATIIDTVALYLLPNKNVYRRHVYDESDEIKKKN